MYIFVLETWDSISQNLYIILKYVDNKFLFQALL